MTSSSTPKRLGELTAYDLGHVITWKDGGATYSGVLDFVKHENRGGVRKTFVSVLAGKWRHSEGYPSNRPVDVERVEGASPADVDRSGGPAAVALRVAGPSSPAAALALADELVARAKAAERG